MQTIAWFFSKWSRVMMLKLPVGHQYVCLNTSISMAATWSGCNSCQHLSKPSCASTPFRNELLSSQTLALDSDSAEEQRMPEYVCIANRYEHTAVVIPVKFQAIFLPELSHGPNQCERVFSAEGERPRCTVSASTTVMNTLLRSCWRRGLQWSLRHPEP